MTPTQVYDRFYDGRSESAAKRALTRDRDYLRENGFDIQYDQATNTYSLQKHRQHLRSLNLDEHEAASLAVAAGAMQYEDIFPLRFALRFGLKKLTGPNFVNRIEVEDDTQLVSHLNSDDNTDEQRETTSRLIETILEESPISFTYEKPDGSKSQRFGIPTGLTLYRGRWYAIVDTEAGPRTFTIAQMFDLVVDTSSPDIAEKIQRSELTAKSIVGVPLQWPINPDDPTYEVELIIPAESAHRANAITGGFGVLTPQEDGSILWHTQYRNVEYLFKTFIANDLRLAPGWPEVKAQFEEFLLTAVSNHG